ncbi:SDR family oxidoreductase [Candidatus Entotheonella palauensis]|uniref:SDR family oxidoreductase n=1 Tax=Candidatus Entotheonella palauensis TaxID=93172 RepID=UPI000B7EC78A|nr:SDR family oxidoreductase [Candidatus Entotheonella palauensis]
MTAGLENKIALVTGGASGIGRATAQAFGRAGAKVVIADVQVEGGQETVSLIKEAGGEAMFVECDVSLAAKVEAMISRCVEVYGRLDCAFNNAGILGDMATTVDCTEENFDRIINGNLKSIWLCMKYEIPQMLAQGGGVIVNAGSNAGMRGVPELPAYSASKGGVVILTRTAALEYAKSGIRINAINPGLIFTPMVQKQTADNPDAVEAFIAESPNGRIGEPEEVAETVVWLCSDAASLVTGHLMAVDGGLLA